MAPTVLRDFSTARVEIKQAWSDSWQVLQPGVLQPLRGANYVPSAGLDYMSFRSRYGRVKLPGEDSIETREPLSLDGWWVRVSIYDAPESDGDIEGEWEVIFQGRFESQLRAPTGKMFDHPACGVQEWTAYGGYRILQRAAINSYWTIMDDGEAAEVGIVASPNLPFRGEGEWFANRSTLPIATPSEHYVFYDLSATAGGRTQWSSLDYVRYLIARHLPDPTGGANPTWTVVGQTDAIESLVEGIRVADPSDVATVLHEAIPRSLGVDWRVVPTDDGFAISVFSLATADAEFDATSLPANPNVFSLDATSLVDTQIQIENTSAQRYRKIVVRGDRLICCASFSFDESEKASLYKGWSDEYEAGYLAAAGDTPGDAEFNDTCRMSGAFDGVFGRFSAWTYDIGSGTSSFPFTGEGNLNPRVDDNGFVLYDEPSEPYGFHQRQTLDWLPLRPNVDYRSLSPFDSADIGDNIEPGDDRLMRPMAFLPLRFDTEADRYVNLRPIEMLGMELAPHTDGIGFHIRANPPHLLAAGHWSGANPTQTMPQYDYETLFATLAYPGTHRIQLVSTDESADESDGTKVIDVPGAQCWYVAQGTIYGSDFNDATTKGVLETTQPLIVRDDRPRLARVMAGAIARYRRNRYRARIYVRGLAPWHQYLGHLLEMINDGTEDTATLKSPITGVEWEFEREFSTVIRTGYAE